MFPKLSSLYDLDKTEGTVQLHKSDQRDTTADILLVPKPSEHDPNDPLRWPNWKKHVAFGSVCAFTFLTNYAIGGLAPAFYLLSVEFDKTMTETSKLLLWPILVLGVFNYFWVPVANYIGKRPVFVFASGLLCICYIWGASARSFRSLLWSNIIAAFAGSSTEALGASIVNDLYFLHERGAKMGVYMNSITGGNTVGPLICGFIITSLSWRWHKWIAVILTALTFIIVVLFVPETRYFRDENQNVSGSIGSSSEDQIGTAEQKKDTSNTTTEVPAETRNAVPRKTWRQEMGLWSGLAPNTNLLKMFLRPFPMFAYPCVIFAFLGYAASLVLTVSVNILNPFVLQAPPYSWSPMINGLINIPGLIGNVFGAYAGGWLVDVFCDWRARRNGGLFEPESRLILLIVPMLITGAGCLLFGYGVERTLHWTSLFFGYGMVSVALTAVPTITMAYVSDCLLPVNADALMLVNGKGRLMHSPIRGTWLTNHRRNQECRHVWLPLRHHPMGGGGRLCPVLRCSNRHFRSCHSAWHGCSDTFRSGNTTQAGQVENHHLEV